jgi:3-oxoacyl-[acyl-carrier protein] reductase
MFNLTEKVALVTGASGGIGRAVAIALAHQGAKVVLTGTRIGALEETASQISTPHTLIVANLGDTATPDSLVDQVIKQYGRLDILVNNAGITRDGLLMRMKDSDWADVLDINLTSVMRLCRAAMKPMMKARIGRIINITSVVGQMGNAGQTNYVAAKAGLTGFSKALAQELASRNITVNAIAPGFIDTAMTGKLNDEQKKAMLARIPLASFGVPEDIAASTVYLASDEARYVTGQTLHVNGGMVMV